jgi:hypothetical protein
MWQAYVAAARRGAWVERVGEAVARTGSFFHERHRTVASRQLDAARGANYDFVPAVGTNS